MLTRILNYLQTKKELQFRFLKAAPFLKKGRYFSNETGTLWYPKRWKEKALPENKYLYQQIVYHNDRAIHAKTKIGKQLQTVRRKLINHFHCGQVTLKNPSLLYDGDVALLFRKPGAGKIINYSKKEILSFFREKKQMQEIFEKQSTWQSFGYPAPAILQTDEEHLFLIEEYIEKQDFSPEAGFEFIKNDILLHQKACGDDGLIVCLPEELAEKVEGLKRLEGEWEGVSGVIDFIQSPNYIKRVCHGDLYRNNLIFDGQKFWYIDFELLCPRVFFFDVVVYFLYEFLIFENDKMLKDFFAGKYDAYFSELFSVNHSVYDPAMKKAYLFLTLYECFCECFKCPIPFQKLKSIF